jgi:MHS family proline/betaine transporter-like MFS transporter
MTIESLAGSTHTVGGPRRSLIAACVGNAVEWYDLALLGGTASVIAVVLTPGGWSGFTTVFAVFATSCLFRPLGSLIIGARADRSGRQPMLAMTILLMALATFAIGLLPPWSAIGLMAPIGLLALRAVQAFSVGGEIGVSVAYLSELGRGDRRGRAGGWYLSTVAIGLALGLGVAAVFATVLDPAALASWGWRVPFLLALPLGLVGVYLRRRLIESPSFASAAAPLRPRPSEVLRDHLPTIRRCLVIGGGFSAAFNVWFLFVPSYIAVTGAAPLGLTLAAALVGLLVLAITAPFFGRLSDRYGRRVVLSAASAALAVGIVPLYLWAMGGSAAALFTSNALIGLVTAAFVLPAFFAEQFPVRVRATGLGLSYGISSAVVGGTAPLLATILSRQVGVLLVPAYLGIWALAALFAVLRSPETLRSRFGKPALRDQIRPATAT